MEDILRELKEAKKEMKKMNKNLKDCQIAYGISKPKENKE